MANKNFEFIVYILSGLLVACLLAPYLGLPLFFSLPTAYDPEAEILEDITPKVKIKTRLPKVIEQEVAAPPQADAQPDENLDIDNAFSPEEVQELKRMLQ